MSRKNKLFEIADRQQRFFAAKQIVKCGYSRSNFHLNLTSGEMMQAFDELINFISFFDSNLKTETKSVYCITDRINFNSAGYKPSPLGGIIFL